MDLRRWFDERRQRPGDLSPQGGGYTFNPSDTAGFCAQLANCEGWPDQLQVDSALWTCRTYKHDNCVGMELGEYAASPAVIVDSFISLRCVKDGNWGGYTGGSRGGGDLICAGAAEGSHC